MTPIILVLSLFGWMTPAFLFCIVSALGRYFTYAEQTLEQEMSRTKGFELLVSDLFIIPRRKKLPTCIDVIDGGKKLCSFEKGCTRNHQWS
jgi:hypothetical protein